MAVTTPVHSDTAGRNLAGWARLHLKPLILAALMAVAYLAALNRAQAMSWGIAALLTATLITGLVWPSWLVQRLSATRRGPERAEEGEIITFHVTVINHGWLPRFMVELVDRIPFGGPADRNSSAGDRTLGMVSYVPGGGMRQFEVQLKCEKRGYYRLGPVGLASSFPLGLAEARQQRNGGIQTLTVYPDVFPILMLPLHGAQSQIHRGGFLLPAGAGAAEFMGLREYRRGDNPRHVHWLSTAKLNELMVKEFEPLASASLHVALDQAVFSNVGKGREATFEYMIRIAASIAKYACDHGLPLRMLGQGERLLELSRGNGEFFYQNILDALAVIDADGITPYAEVLQRMALDCQHGDTVVAFLAEPAFRVPTTLQALAALRAQGANLFAIVLDRASYLAPDAQEKLCPSGMIMATLLDLDARCLLVRKGNDLVQLFNA